MVLQWWGSKPNLFSLYTGFWTVTGAVLNLLESFAKASEGGFVTCLFWAQLGWLTGKFNLADIYIGIGITIAIGHLIWRLLSRP
jgi:lipoprotein signal peptidase